MISTEWTRRRFLQSAVGTTLALAAGGSNLLAQNPGQALRDLAARKGLLYGCATTRQFLTQDAPFAELVNRQCGLLVPETELKWKYVEPQPDQFNFESADWMLKYAHEQGMQLRGHTLVWHESLPPWISSVNSTKAKQVMVSHIEKVMNHYRSQTQSWNVVNEALAFRGAGEMRDTVWLRLLGPSYIDIAYHTAAEADPKALLVYNDNHLEYDDPDDQFRRDTLLRLLKRWVVSNKLPIGALGIQAHLRTGNAIFNPQLYADFLNRVSDMGLKIIISELDVSEKGPENNLPDRDRAVGRAIYQFLTTALRNTSVIAVVTWGLAARHTWIPPRASGQPSIPLPYDRDLRPTSAWRALATAFEEAPRR